LLTAICAQTQTKKSFESVASQRFQNFSWGSFDRQLRSALLCQTKRELPTQSAGNSLFVLRRSPHQTMRDLAKYQKPYPFWLIPR
jgi:hypothetical protein